MEKALRALLEDAVKRRRKCEVIMRAFTDEELMGQKQYCRELRQYWTGQEHLIRDLLKAN